MLTKKSLILVLMVAALVLAGSVSSYAADGKVGFVDLRKAFYDYSKTKTFETQLNDLTSTREGGRNKMVEEVTKMRDEIQMLQGDAKNKKQADMDNKIATLQEYDRETRQQLLNKKNDMFKEVIDDIQKVVETIGKANGYDYILDSRNVMYGKEELDLTNQVVTQLNGAAPAKTPAKPGKK